MLKQNPRFGLCLKLWTAPQSNYFCTLNEKNWHTYKLTNTNQYIDSDKQILPSFSSFLWCLPDPFVGNMKNNTQNWKIMLPFSSYTIFHTPVKYWLSTARSKIGKMSKKFRYGCGMRTGLLTVVILYSKFYFFLKKRQEFAMSPWGTWDRKALEVNKDFSFSFVFLCTLLQRPSGQNNQPIPGPWKIMCNIVTIT